MHRLFLFIILFVGLFSMGTTSANSGIGPVRPGADTISSGPIIFTPETASDYIMNLSGMENLWRVEQDTLRLSLDRLIDHFNEPFDSVSSRLSRFPYDSIEITPGMVQRTDTLPVRWLNKEAFFIDTLALNKEPLIIQQTVIVRALDTLSFREPIPEFRAMIDSFLQVRDTITEVLIDFRYLASRGVQIHRLSNDSIIPPLVPSGNRQTAAFLSDSSRIVFSESFPALLANKESPFYMVPGMNTADSLHAAAGTLLAYAHQRDSIPLFFSDIQGRSTTFWLTSGKDELFRYWVKNTANDSITIWLGNPSKYELAMILEDEVHVERMEVQQADDIPITTARPERALARVRLLEEIPVYWDHGLNSSFSLNQNYLSNWARGGESSFSSMLDINATAKYTNKESQVTWTNRGRLRYGTIRTKEQGFRTNADIIELNSQYNKELREKLDFSSVFYAKTQSAKGYNYPNDSVPVSRFLNPGTFTLGVGVEYEPFKKTLINFSVLSYKNTFVLDTADIIQSTHGIDPARRSRQEMGGQLVIKNSLAILETLNVTNSIRLFSNYLHKPKNVDVDWETTLEQQINWYFTIRLNLHLIYDDDIRFPVFDGAGEPVLLPDGSQRKVAKTQFNQFLGLTLSFKI